MPYELKKSGGQYCVYKKGDSSPVPGGCHATRKEAVAHMRALYVNVEGSLSDPPATMEDAQVIADNNGWALEKIDGTAFWRLKNVPIASTGIEYALSTGKHTFTPEDLADAVAAQEDPAIVQPRIWLGHTDPRFNGDGEPALGRVEAMRLSEDGNTILGDYVGLPEWLAKIMPVAYPSRSIEGQVNAKTVTGKQYGLVITAVKQLGIVWPGISTLEDIPVLLSSQGPKDVKIEAAKGGTLDIAAEVNVEDVRRAFYDELQAQEDPNKKWWWIRVQQVVSGKGQLIVDDDNGQLYRVEYSVSGEKIKFADPVPVKIQYQDQPADSMAAAAAVIAGICAVDDVPKIVYASREESLIADDKEATSTSTEGVEMDEATRKFLAAKFGLAEDASEQEIEGILAGVGNGKPKDVKAETETPPDADDGDEDDGNSADEDEESETTPASTPATPTAAQEGVVSVDAATWEEVRANAALAAKMNEDRIAADDGRMLDDAIRAGKFPPSRKEHYVKLLKADRDGTKSMIEGLSPGLIPVSERGNSGGSEELKAGQASNAAEGLPGDWFPEVASIRARAAQERHVFQAKEG